MVGPKEFKAGMRCLGGAVTIIATAHGSEKSGLTATAVTSLSDAPPRLLACINQQGNSFEICSKSKRMSINVLSVDDQALALRFAGLDGSTEAERFTKGTWIESHQGVPYLQSSLVSFVCRVDNIIDTGSHGIVIGLIEDIHIQNPLAKPLAYINGMWTTFAPTHL